MTKLLYAASAAALLSVAGAVPSIAQSSSSGVTGGSMTAPMITCRDLSAMDRETQRSVVFYFSGFHSGSGMATSNQASAGAASGSSGTTTDTSGAASTSADAGSSTSGSTTETTGSGSSTAADATGSSTSGSTTESTAADAGSSTSTTDTTGSTSTAGGTTGGASSAVVAQLPGFSNIDVDRIMADCQSSPDRQLSEVIQSGMGAGGTAQ